MSYGYMGKILRTDLRSGRIWIEEPDGPFYRKYVGGGCLATYYLLKHVTRQIDALGKDNLLVFSTGPTTGAPISGASRFNINAKSPLTGVIGDSQGGGYWGCELKRAGFDAIVISGRSHTPVYLLIRDGRAEIMDASHLWGKNVAETEDLIRDQLSDSRARVAAIGPAGENQVMYAAVCSDRRHVAGRTGMGAVMGSKGLKAIAVRGTAEIKFFDPLSIKQMARWGAKEIKKNADMRSLRDLGTAGSILDQQDAGGLPTRNFSSGVFKGAGKISGQALKENLLLRTEGCESCAVRCKRIVGGGSYEVDARYGGPEYESVASLGSYLLVDDLDAICKANELCNKYGIDTISLGGTLAFAMECFEQGLLTHRDTGGLELRFGNAEAVLEIIDRIAHRQGVGDLLADGPEAAARTLGPEASRLCMTVKGNPLPAHMPRVKGSLALAYSLNPFGADHQSSEHDFIIVEGAPTLQRDRAMSLGLLDTASEDSLNYEKVRLFAYSQWAYSALDTLDLCQFCFSGWGLYSFQQAAELLAMATGWSTSLWDIMKTGERRVNMMRVFNATQGVEATSDSLPDRLFEPLIAGPTAGHKLTKSDWSRAKEWYYDLAGWDCQTGNPRPGKLLELGLDWLIGEHEAIDS